MSKHLDQDRIDKALNGVLGEDQRIIADEGLKWVGLLLRKNIDYGSSAFEPPLLVPDLPASLAIRVRMSDKIKRLIKLNNSDPLVQSETSLDTIDDLGAYALLLRVQITRETAKHRKAARDPKFGGPISIESAFTPTMPAPSESPDMSEAVKRLRIRQQADVDPGDSK